MKYADWRAPPFLRRDLAGSGKSLLFLKAAPRAPRARSSSLCRVTHSDTLRQHESAHGEWLSHRETPASCLNRPANADSRVQLTKADEATAGDEVEVRREDQDKINKFSRLHQRELNIQDELKAKMVQTASPFRFHLLLFSVQLMADHAIFVHTEGKGRARRRDDGARARRRRRQSPVSHSVIGSPMANSARLTTFLPTTDTRSVMHSST